MSTRQVNYNINVTGNLEAKVKSATKGFDKLGKEVDGVKKNIGKASGKGGVGMAGAFAGLGPIIAGAFAVDQIIQFGKEVFDITARFQRFEAVLTNSLGSNSEAMRAMEMIQEFAANTPFSVDGLTDSFIKFANRGVVPTVNQLTNLGDLSSALGKDFDQLTEAILDVSNTERWNELGIKVKSAGDLMTGTFRGVTVEVARTEAGALQMAQAFGQMQGVAGGMEAISQTLGGQVSNLGDNFDALKLKIGNAFAGEGSGAINLVSKAVQFLTDLVDPLVEYFNLLIQPFKDIYSEITNLFGGLGDGVNVVKILTTYFKILTIKFRVVTSLIGFLVKRGAELLSFLGGLIAKVAEWIGISSELEGLISIFEDAFDAFNFIWDNLPAILEASWQTFLDFFGDLLDLTINTGKSIFNILKEAFDFSKISKGDLSGVKNELAKAIGQFKRDTETISLTTTFKDNLQKLLAPGPVSGEAVNASDAATAINSATANAELTKVDDEVTGTKATNINLNIEKLIETLTFNTSNLAESSTKIKEEVTRVLIEALRDTTAIATN